MTNKRISKSVSEQSQKRIRLSSTSNASTSDISMNMDNGRVGKILSVTLKNFMCHDNLKFDFTPNVNFIIGRNGSGKSAVLTGIILALGGKSSVTGRFTNLKGFIKTGKQTAYITVTLSNQGETPYKPEVYGSKIVIERTITADGSSYKLKSHAGQIIYTSKEELDKILDYFKIQIDNPISILTQETSRCFLDSKNPKDKYKCFYKATQLEKLRDNYVNAEKKRKESEQLLTFRKEALPEMEKDIKKLETILERSLKIIEYENELTWSCVIEKEKQRDDKLKEYTLVQKAVKMAEEKLKESDQRYQKNCTCLEENKLKLTECKTDVDTLKNEVERLDGKLKLLTKDKAELKYKMNRADRELNKTIEEIGNLEKSIQETRDKSKQDVIQEKIQREAKIAKAVERKGALKRDEIAYNEKHSNLVLNSNQVTNTIHQLKNETFEINKKKLQIQNELVTFQHSMKDPIHIFGPYMQQLLQDIDRAAEMGRFKQKPIGPIARFVKVKEKDWSVAVAAVLGESFLKSFCCDNFDDRRELTNLMAACQHNSTRNSQSILQGHQIIVSKFLPNVHNVEANKTRSERYPTVFDMIECSNTVVKNCLIDQKSIESILLIGNRQDAVNLMMNKPPAGCQSCYLSNADQIYPSPKYRYYSCKNTKASIFLQSVKQDDVRLKQQQIRDLDSKMQQIQKDLLKENQIKSELAENVSNLIKKIKDNASSIARCDQEIENLSHVEELKDLNCLQDDLKTQYAEKDRLVEQKQTCLLHSKNINQTYDENKKILEAKKADYNEKISYCSRYQDHIHQLEECKLSSTSEKHRFQNLVHQEKDKLALIEKEYNDAERDATITANEAVKVCPRVITTRSPNAVEAVLNETRKHIEQESKCKRTDLKLKLHEKKKQLKKTTENVEYLNSLLEQLEKMVVIRFKGFQDIQTTTCCIVEYEFLTSLKTNKFVGEMIFNHDKDTLIINAKPSSTSKNSNNNTKELSGGERSYVTICFLLALWNCIETPFRILDEYDVFMDSVNRQLSLSLMIDIATKDSDKQFIFLSPLELPIMDKSPLVKVHKMPAPKRLHDDVNP